MPNSFCISYKQARENDMEDGIDYGSHKSDEILKDVTLNLDEKSLKQLFTSVGLADKDGIFPIISFVEQSENLDGLYANFPEKNINEHLSLFTKFCPDFAKCINESMQLLDGMISSLRNFSFKKCVINRVYSKSDKDKRPIFYIYINSNELGEKFYFANKDIGQFVELSPEDFISQFECYEEDLEKNNRL